MQALLRRILTRGFLGLALLAFLMPFVTLSCGHMRLITMNGVQMATGAKFKPHLGGNFPQATTPQKVEPNAGAVLAIIVSVAAFGCAFVGGTLGRVLPAFGSGVGVLSMLALKFQFDGAVAKRVSDAGGTLPLAATWEIGYWLSILAMAVACIFACLPDRGTTVAAPSPQPVAPPFPPGE